MKTVEQLKALEALFQEKENNPTGKRKAKRSRRDAELDREYRLACMKPVDLYNLEVKGHKKRKPADFRKAEKLEVKRGGSIKGGHKAIKLRIVK